MIPFWVALLGCAFSAWIVIVILRAHAEARVEAAWKAGRAYERERRS